MDSNDSNHLIVIDDWGCPVPVHQREDYASNGNYSIDRWNKIQEERFAEIKENFDKFFRGFRHLGLGAKVYENRN